MAEGSSHSVPHAFVDMAAWIELFYDLVFVAAILVFSSAVSHLHDAARIGWVVAVFAAVWWVWLSTTVYMNRFHTEDVGQRLLVLGQMFLVTLIAMEARAGVAHDAAYLTATYGVLIATIAVMYGRSGRRDGSVAAFARQLSRLHAGAAACFFVAAPLPDPLRIPIVALAFGILIGPALARASRPGSSPPLDEGHLTERMGAFTIIVCGEAFVKVAIVVSNGSIEGIDVVALAFEFLLTFALWATYFPDVPRSGVNPRRVAPWIGLHLLLQLGIAGTAIGVSKLVHVGLLDELPAEDILEIMAPLAVVYLALAGIGPSTRRRPQHTLGMLRLATMVVVVAVGFVAWLIPSVDVAEGTALLTIVALVHMVVAARVRSSTTVEAIGGFGVQAAF